MISARTRLVVLLSMLARTAGGEPVRPLPREVVAALAGAAAQGPVALVESKPDGTMRQVTLIVLVHAPAEQVRALVADVGAYPRFVPNLKQADFKQAPDGQWVNSWRLELPISSFTGRDVYEISPTPLGPIGFHSLDTLARYEWQFVPVGGGTLLVQAGYADVLHANRFVRVVVRRQPAMEHGLALAAQYMLVSAVRDEAERRSGRPAIAVPPTEGAALERMSERGQVVVMRSSAGKLEEVSILDRVYAPERRVHDVIVEPGDYSAFIAGVDRSVVTDRGAGELAYALEMSLPVVTWSTQYRMRLGEHAIDGVGVSGDLRGARYRWDLAMRGPSETLVIYRANQPLSRGSFVVRKLFEVDSSLEYGLNVAFALLQLRSVRGRAEGWATK